MRLIPIKGMYTGLELVTYTGYEFDTYTGIVELFQNNWFCATVSKKEKMLSVFYQHKYIKRDHQGIYLFS